MTGYMERGDLVPSVSELQAEIQRLLTANEALKSLCEEYQAQIKQAREYVPMTGERIGYLTVVEPALHRIETPILADYIRQIETEFIKRAGLIIKEKE